LRNGARKGPVFFDFDTGIQCWSRHVADTTSVDAYKSCVSGEAVHLCSWVFHHRQKIAKARRTQSNGLETANQKEKFRYESWAIGSVFVVLFEGSQVPGEVEVLGDVWGAHQSPFGAPPFTGENSLGSEENLVTAREICQCACAFQSHCQRHYNPNNGTM
jgi:hypothetical protein